MYQAVVPERRIPLPLLIPDWFFLTGDIITQGVSVTANQVYYIPFTIPYDVQLVSISFYHNSTAGNYDLGLYDSGGAKVSSKGSTAGTTSAVNTWTLTDSLPLVGGAQYFGAFVGSTTMNIAVYSRTAAGGNVHAPLTGMMIQSSSSLPSNATFSTAGTSIMPVLSLTFNI